MPRNPSYARDAAVVRMRRISRWLVAGAVMLTGLLTDVAAQAFPGHSVARRTGTASTTEVRHAHDSTRVARGHRTKHRPLKPPAHPPQTPTTASQTQSEPQTTASPTPAPAPAAPVVSGGS